MTGQVISVGRTPTSNVRASTWAHDPRYSHLSLEAQEQAKDFFHQREIAAPHLAWMENRFLDMVETVTSDQLAPKVPADQIVAPDIDDENYFADSRQILSGDELRYNELAQEAYKQGQVLQLELVAGMASGFGGIAKGAVSAVSDVRFRDERGLTFLDYKLERLLEIQRNYQKIQPNALMVSDESEADIVQNLRAFAEERQINVVVIREATPREALEKIQAEYADKWKDTLVIAMIRQPSTFLLSEDGQNIGELYMKGHGDTYDVIKSQLPDFFDVFGIRYVFASNIDNIGGLQDETLLGYFIEQHQQRQIEAMVEMAEKFEGDKGGVPHLRGLNPSLVFSILEELEVPDEWKDRFYGTEVFPFFNTNTFWLLADAIIKRNFQLPYMSKLTKDKKKRLFNKIETILGHGLGAMPWLAMKIDRGERFIPSKFLADLWIGRTDWIMQYKGRLLPAKRDGRYVPKARIEVGKKLLPDVATLNNMIFGGGAYDSMERLSRLVIGGAGEDFDGIGQAGDFETKCPVDYEGNVAVVYLKGAGGKTGKLTIESTGPNDRIMLKDTLIVVPPEGRTITRSQNGQKDAIDQQLLQATVTSATSRWPESARLLFLSAFN
ncbi:MAG: UTP--glucose-1-phosphate uridylyltransferase [bacterium]